MKPLNKSLTSRLPVVEKYDQIPMNYFSHVDGECQFYVSTFVEVQLRYIEPFSVIELSAISQDIQARDYSRNLSFLTSSIII